MSVVILWLCVFITPTFGAVVIRDKLPLPYYQNFTKGNTFLYQNHVETKDTSCECGVPNFSRIVGGVEVSPKRKYPWQVGLLHPEEDIFCGGSIINDRWIITAAHCSIVDITNCQPHKWLTQLRVVVGEHQFGYTYDDDSNTKEYKIKTWVNHPDYNCKPIYDLALLELTEAIPFNHVIRPICLPKDDSNTYVGQTGIVSGWGRTSTKGPVSTVLQEVQVPILANDKCEWWSTRLPILLCAGGKKDFCKGDSGGPLSVIENRKHVQVGVVSYFNKIVGCGSTYFPGIYTRTSKFIPWIETTAASGMKCD